MISGKEFLEHFITFIQNHDQIFKNLRLSKRKNDNINAFVIRCDAITQFVGEIARVGKVAHNSALKSIHLAQKYRQSMDDSQN